MKLLLFGKEVCPTLKFENIDQVTFKEIRKNSEIKNWFYCNTKNNPADILTRSKGFEKFQENSFW